MIKTRYIDIIYKKQFMEWFTVQMDEAVERLGDELLEIL